MSSQISKRVHCVTKKGKKCRRNATKGEIYCHQCQEKKEPMTSLVHIKPSYKFVPVVFNDAIVSDSTCKYKNKYGEFVCTEERKGDYCDEHNIKYKKFYSLMLRLVRKFRTMNDTETTFDAIMNIFYNIYNCMYVHREWLVNFSQTKAIKTVNSIMSNKLAQFLHDFTTDVQISSNLRRYKKSLPMEYHINKIKELQNLSNDMLIDVQISKSRNSLISNNIKIHKLSEIYIRNKSDDKQPCSFISKGIDKKILSFIV